MTRNASAFSLALAAGVALAGTAFLGTREAQAQQTYPRIVGSGESAYVDYGPDGPRGPIFGGGRVLFIMMDGANVTLMHLDDEYVQQPLPGYVAMAIGSGEDTRIVYVPQMTVDIIRAMMPGMTRR